MTIPCQHPFASVAGNGAGASRWKVAMRTPV